MEAFCWPLKPNDQQMIPPIWLSDPSSLFFYNWVKNSNRFCLSIILWRNQTRTRTSIRSKRSKSTRRSIPAAMVGCIKCKSMLTQRTGKKGSIHAHRYPNLHHFAWSPASELVQHSALLLTYRYFDHPAICKLLLLHLDHQHAAWNNSKDRKYFPN